MFTSAIVLAAASLSLQPLILLLVAVLVGLVVCYCVGLFVSDPKIITVVRLIVGLIVLFYGLQLFNIVQ